MYNLTVEAAHTYHVGEDRWLVHNACSGDQWVDFYTVQSPSDAARLRGSGTPWPSEEHRAALGEGVYAWGRRSDAEEYFTRLSRRRSDLEVMEFQVRQSDLDSFQQVNVDSLPEPEAWMERYSRLWEGTPDHGQEYIQRGTALGVEHYFHQSVFLKLKFK